MTSWHSYPKVYALGHRAIADLLLEEVVVQEKGGREPEWYKEELLKRQF